MIKALPAPGHPQQMCPEESQARHQGPPLNKAIAPGYPRQDHDRPDASRFTVGGSGRPGSRSAAVRRAPLHHAAHPGDLIIVVDADPGVGVAGGAERAQEREVLLNLGQGRAVSEALVPLACVSVLGSHTHHLRDVERDHERRPASPASVLRTSVTTTSCARRRRRGRGRRAPFEGLMVIPPSAVLMPASVPGTSACLRTPARGGRASRRSEAAGRRPGRRHDSADGRDSRGAPL